MHLSDAQFHSYGAPEDMGSHMWSSPFALKNKRKCGCISVWTGWRSDRG